MHFTPKHHASGYKALFLMGIMAGFLCAAFSQPYTGEPSNRVTINMGETPWKFIKDKDNVYYYGTPNARDTNYNDNSWSDVGIPHCYNATDMWLNMGNGYNDAGATHHGMVWYRKHFTVPASYSGRRIEVEFQGVNIGCAVYINGKLKPSSSAVKQNEATHVVGHLPFVVDITDEVKYSAHNVIAVRVSNGWDNFFTMCLMGTADDNGTRSGGIHRPVYMHVTDKVHVPINVYSNVRRWGTYVGTKAATASSATVQMQTNVYNDDTQSKSVVVTTKIVDAQNNVVATQTSPAQTINAGSSYVFDQTAMVSNPHLWYPNNNPNGRPYMYKVYHIVQVGGQTVDVFKTPLGIRMITWDKDFAYVNGKKHIFWGYGSRYEYPGFGSAVPTEQQWRDIKLMAESGASLLRPGHVPIATATVEACDAYGVCLFENTMDKEWAIKGEPVVTYKGEFHRDCIIRDRNHPSLFVWEINNGFRVGQEAAGVIKNMCDTVKKYDYIAPRTSSTRDGSDYWPADPNELILGTNTGFRRIRTDRPNWGAESWPKSNARFSYDYEMPFVDRFIQETNTVITLKGAGLVHWMFMECGGENYATFGDPSFTKEMRKTLGASAVDHNRIPKLIYNVYKNALWVPFTTRPGVVLQSHWNYSAGTRTVTAFSNCPSVELFVNGVSKGVKTPNATTTKCEWTGLAWASGTLRAEGRDASGKVVCSDERKTAGAPSKIVLTVEPAIIRPDNGEVFMIRANGTDAAFILATIVDAQGNWCPLATNNITFKVTGAGSYVGSSNYIADLSKGQNYHAPLDPELAAEGGMMKVGVRSTFTPGTVTVEASAAGLASATATFQTYDLNTPPVVGAGPAVLMAPVARAQSATFKTVGTSFLVPVEFTGKPVSIKIYNLSGKLMREAVARERRISLRHYGVAATGTFIVRCREIALPENN